MLWEFPTTGGDWEDDLNNTQSGKFISKRYIRSRDYAEAA
jgi:hypothetical protein